MSYTKPSAFKFQSHFDRDFPYGEDMSLHVTPNDINKAMKEADVTINPDLFSSQESYNLGYLLLSAHILCINMQTSSQGLNGSFGFLTSSKSVGGISESYNIPAKIAENPIFSFYTKTNYGAKYINMVMPYLTGGMSILCGGTQA